MDEKTLNDYKCGPQLRPDIAFLSDEELPKLSVLTPTYNRRKFLTLASFNLYIMDYPKDKLEWVILDDGDEPFFPTTQDLDNCRKYLRPMKINYVYNNSRHMSIGEKRNKLVKMSSNKICAFLDDDDIYLPSYLRYSISMMKHYKAGLCASPEMYFIFPFDEWKTSMIRCAAKRQGHEATMVFTKKFFNSMPGFNKSSQGEGAGMVDWNEKNVIKTECDKIMICVSHKDNTIPKDREDFKKNETQLAIDLPRFKILEDILGVKYLKKIYPNNIENNVPKEKSE